MIYGISSETSSSMHLMSDCCLNTGNPFSFMFKKLIELLSDSAVESPELSREIHSLQQGLQEKVLQRKLKLKRGRCHVMHEMKNALTGILSCAHVLHDDALKHEDREEFLSLIRREVERIVGMAGEFNEHRNESANTLYFQDFTVDAFFATLTPLVEKYTLAERNIALCVDAEYTGPIRIDIEKIQQAFMNIIYNARDAMPEGGSLTIRSRVINKETLLFEFIDKGCGMSPEMLEHIFEPFTTEGKKLGTGLGMAIVKEIVDEHHGKVEVESAPGEGTTVRILLPLTQTLRS